MRVAEEARQMVLRQYPQTSGDERERASEQQAILCSLDNLMTFSWVREGVVAGALELHGWYFDIEHGQLLRYDAANRSFKAL